MTTHEYLSTACYHGSEPLSGELHRYCQSKMGMYGPKKKPSSCKFCGAPCSCPCHDQPATPEPGAA